MTAAVAVLLDAVTIFGVTAWLLSAIAALVPLPAASGAQAREALRLALLPAVGGAVVVAAAFWPSAWTAMVASADHCEAGVAGHPHLCWLHASAGPVSWHDGLAAGGALILAVVLGSRIAAWGIASRRVSRLGASCDAGRTAAVAAALSQAGITFPGPIWVVPADRPWCFVTGIRRPTLVLASSVVDALSPTDLAVVTAHEAAHIRHRDPAWRLVVDLASVVHAPWLDRRAARRWAAAAERTCDDQAAAEVGSGITVAETLVRLQRLVNGAMRQPGLAFSGEAPIERRVRALLDAPPVARDLLRGWPWVAIALVTLGAERVHAALEAVLGGIHG